MKAAVWHGYKDIRITDCSIPHAEKGSVVVKVAWAGICGTDRHEYLGPNFIPVTKPHRLTGKTAPLILGHEFAGLISEVGEGVRGWKTGDRVMANGTLSCGVCEACRSGRYNICEKLGFVGVSRDGAFAEYVAVEAVRLFKVPGGLTLRRAVLAEPLACGIHAARLLGEGALPGDGPSRTDGPVLRGKKVLISGPGIIGLSCFFAAKLAEAAEIIVAGIGNPRRELVEQSGGRYIDISRENLAEAVKTRFGGLADICYECVGRQSSLDSCISLLKGGGALMVMGVYEKPPVFPMNDFQEGERRLFTSQAHTNEIATALDYLEKGLIAADPLITGEVTLDALAEEGFEELAAHAMEHKKVVIRIGGGE